MYSKKSTKLPKYPILSTLNEIVMDNSSPSGVQIDRYKQFDPEKTT